MQRVVDVASDIQDGKSSFSAWVITITDHFIESLGSNTISHAVTPPFLFLGGTQGSQVRLAQMTRPYHGHFRQRLKNP